MKYIKILSILMFLPLIVNAQGVNTAFTYQGELTVNGVPANGTYDMSFDAYEVATGGTSLLIFGADVHTNITVSNGLFTVQNVDFGDLIFTSGPDTWIELAVKPSSGGNYTTLSPRQQITTAPYAIKSGYSNLANFADGLSIPGNAYDVLVNNGTSWVSGGNKIRVSSIGVSVGTTSVPPADGLRVGGVSNFDDDLNQNVNKSGLPKYMISATCANDTSIVSISTKNLTGANGQASIEGSTTTGYCFITFPVSLGGRFWVANSENSDGGNVSCALSSSDSTQLKCQIVDRNGSYQDGDFQLIIF
ncbi:MAG: hypothetical protein ACWA5R_11270 [bacterium]